MATAAAAAEEGRCKKSSSTGSCSSKRWRLRNLLHWSNSNGKDSFIFLSHSESRNARKREGNIKKIEKLSGVAPKIPKSAAGKVAPEIPKAAGGKVAPATTVSVKNYGEKMNSSYPKQQQKVVLMRFRLDLGMSNYVGVGGDSDCLRLQVVQTELHVLNLVAC